MSKRSAKPAKPTAELPTDYATLLADIKARVQSARIKAGLAANRELLALYWDIGRLILVRQRREGWGAKVIDRVAPVRLCDGFVGRRLGSATTKRSGDSNEIEPVILVGY